MPYSGTHETRQYNFHPKWKEILVCQGPDGPFELDYVMGVPTIYAPDESAWAQRFPDTDHITFAKDIADWCLENKIQLMFVKDAFIDTLRVSMSVSDQTSQS